MAKETPAPKLAAFDPLRHPLGLAVVDRLMIPCLGPWNPITTHLTAAGTWSEAAAAVIGLFPLTLDDLFEYSIFFSFSFCVNLRPLFGVLAPTTAPKAVHAYILVQYSH